MGGDRSDDVTWVVVPAPRGDRSPQWARSACIDAADTVFIPAAISGNEMMAVLAAAWDGNVPFVIDDDHVYLPARWVAANYPDMADLCEVIEVKTRTLIAK